MVLAINGYEQVSPIIQIKQSHKQIGLNAARYLRSTQASFFPRNNRFTRLPVPPEREEIFNRMQAYFKRLFVLSDLTHLMTCLEPIKVIPTGKQFIGIHSGVKAYDCYLGNLKQMKYILRRAVYGRNRYYSKHYFHSNRNDLKKYLKTLKGFNLNNIPFEIHYGYTTNSAGELLILHGFKWKVPNSWENYPTPCFKRVSAIAENFGSEFLESSFHKRNLLSSYWYCGLENKALIKQAKS